MKVALVTPNFNVENWRLQPWRYLTEVILGLQRIGHDVNIISMIRRGDFQTNAYSKVEGVPIYAVRTSEGRKVLQLDEMLDRLAVERVIWHVGLTSFVYRKFRLARQVPSLGVFTSPVYSLKELFVAGIRNLLLEPHISAMHILGLLVPIWAIRSAVASGGLRTIVTLSETTRHKLVRKGLSADSLQVIAPGLSQRWREAYQESQVKEARKDLGFKAEDIIIAYAGSPLRLRGVDLLVRSTVMAMKDLDNLRLLILSRNPGHLNRAENRLRKLASRLLPNGAYRIVSGFLAAQVVKTYLAAADIIALPFQLVPSDVPMSINEALALGKPLVTTKTGCLPEMVSEECGRLVPVSDRKALTNAIMDLASNPHERAQMARRAKESARQVKTWEAVARIWDKMLVQE